MNTKIQIRSHWTAVLFLLLGCLPQCGMAQTTSTDQYEMVLEKIDGTILVFKITEDYPLLQYQFGGDDGINTIEIQATGSMGEYRTVVPCPEIKRLYTRAARILKGDVNMDGKVDEADMELVVDYILNPSEDFNKDVADVNEDGEVNIVDVVLIVNKIK